MFLACDQTPQQILSFCIPATISLVCIESILDRKIFIPAHDGSFNDYLRDALNNRLQAGPS